MRPLFLLLALLVLLAAPATAADWGQIKPGASTQAAVRSRYGAPTRETPQKVEGYDTVQWLYEGPQAPVGMTRMTVDFGLLTPSGYRKDVVRRSGRAQARGLQPQARGRRLGAAVSSRQGRRAGILPLRGRPAGLLRQGRK